MKKRKRTKSRNKSDAEDKGPPVNPASRKKRLLSSPAGGLSVPNEESKPSTLPPASPEKRRTSQGQVSVIIVLYDLYSEICNLQINNIIINEPNICEKNQESTTW